MKGIKLQSHQYFLDASKELSKKYQDINIFSLSKIDKISINVGIGKFKNDSKLRMEIEKYLTAITGQQPKVIDSKLSIAGFKLRKGEPVGLAVTLRGKKMEDFFLHLIYVALPRSRDFKGLKNNSFDKAFSSYSLGIDSTTIFPVIGFDSSVQFGMQINIVFKTKHEQNKELLQLLNFPFSK